MHARRIERESDRIFSPIYLSRTGFSIGRGACDLSWCVREGLRGPSRGRRNHIKRNAIYRTRRGVSYVTPSNLSEAIALPPPLPPIPSTSRRALNWRSLNLSSDSRAKSLNSFAAELYARGMTARERSRSPRSRSFASLASLLRKRRQQRRRKKRKKKKNKKEENRKKEKRSVDHDRNATHLGTHLTSAVR